MAATGAKKSWTVLEILNTTVEYFQSKKLNSPRVDTEYLLADVLGIKRIELYVRYAQPLMDSEISRFREYVKRRGTGEPLQYILGDQPFMGLPIKVDKRALIPRPETESLVEKIFEKFAPQGDESSFAICDVGTGTGAIAIALADGYKEARIYACDISVDALTLAKENVEANGFLERIKLLKSDVLSRFDGKGISFDVVVSNPPYVTEDEMKEVSAELEWEPQNALVAGKDGLDVIRPLIDQAPSYLKSGGMLFIEIGEGQGESLLQLLNASNAYKDCAIFKDLNERDRIAFAVRK